VLLALLVLLVLLALLLLLVLLVLLALLVLLVRLAVGLLRLVPRPHPSEGDAVEACNSTPNTMPNDALIRRARPKTASRQIVFRPECRAS